MVTAASAALLARRAGMIEASVPERDFVMLRRAADRIGHGVPSVRDRDLTERLARERVPIEVCPTPNVVIGVFPSLGALVARDVARRSQRDDQQRRPAVFLRRP